MTSNNEVLEADIKEITERDLGSQLLTKSGLFYFIFTHDSFVASWGLRRANERPPSKISNKLEMDCSRREGSLSESRSSTGNQPQTISARYSGNPMTF